MRVHSTLSRLLAGITVSMLAGVAVPAAQAQEAGEQALTPSVTITHTFVSALRMYKRFYPGLVEFERSKNMAPSAELRFALVSGSHPLKRLNVSSIMIDQKDFPSVRVPVAADGSFALPLLPEALEANAAVVISRRKGGDFLWRVSVRQAGLPDHEYRLGDLRLECRVYIAIQRGAAGMFEGKRSFKECERDKLFLNSRPGPALRQIVLTHGGRREVIDLGAHQFDSRHLDLRLPQAADDLAGWPDEAKVELLYAQASKEA